MSGRAAWHAIGVMRLGIALVALALGSSVALADAAAGAGDHAPPERRGSGSPARVATLTVAPAAVRRGGRLAVRGLGFPGRRGGTVRLGAGGRARVRTGARGRFAIRIRVRREARTGRRRLTVRIGARRVATVVRISRHRGHASVLVMRSTGQRVVLAPAAGVAGSVFRVRGAGFRRGGHVRIRLAQRRVRRVRVGRSGRFATSGRVPSLRPGRRRVTVRWRGRRLAMPFVLRAAHGRAPGRRPPGRDPASPAPAPAPAAPAPPASAPAPTVVAAAGDIACGHGNAAFNGGAGTAEQCRQQATGDLLRRLAPAAVLPLGDLQYETGALADFRAAYAPAWGPLDPIARPVPGDDEYETPGAAGYFDYFGARAGERGRGYYSFDLGAWHLIALNSACAHVSCAAGSPQEEWLRLDLAAHPGACTLAYWHASRFESGPPPQATDTGPFWDDLHAAGADVVLGANAHLYERFAPQDPSRAPDPSGGIRQFVVGTGGRSLHAFTTVRANSEVRIAAVFGVLALTLRPGGYDWRFVSVSGAVLDAGAAPCH